ncbi:MAG: KEOPS complex subunit Cgi121 [Candidatus Micrarchaeia archaeon]|jgi:tRNA threonylcarbamoyladenosine modification (KEOPS) complex Cgi121 subunit
MVLVRISSQIKDIREIINILDKSNKIYQVLNPDYIISKKQVEIAYELSKKAFKDKRNKAKSINNEILLWICSEKHVSRAIQKAGAKETNDFFLFYEWDDINKILNEIKAKKKKLVFTPDLTIFQLNKNTLKNYKLEDIILEKMAVSYLER